MASSLATSGIENGSLRSYAISLAGHVVLIGLIFFLPGRPHRVFVENVPRSVRLVATLDMPAPPAPTPKLRRPAPPPPSSPRPKRARPAPPPPPAESKIKMPDREAPPLIRTRTTAAESAPLSEKLASKLSLDEAPAPAEKSFPDLSVPEVAPLDVPLVSVPSAARDERQVALSNSRYATYTGKVEKIIKRRWVVPSGFSLGGRKLTAVGVIRVSREGQILKVEIKRPSGHRLYDQSVLASMTGTIKLPPFPGDMKEDSLDVEITFRPDSR